MPPFIRLLVTLYGMLAPYLNGENSIRKWIGNNKLMTILFATMLIQLFIILVEVDQLYESNRQIILRNDKIHELEISNEHLTDKIKVLATVLDRLASGPLDELKSTETTPLPETEIKSPIETPPKPNPRKEDPYVRGTRRSDELAMEDF